MRDKLQSDRYDVVGGGVMGVGVLPVVGGIWQLHKGITGDWRLTTSPPPVEHISPILNLFF